MFQAIKRIKILYELYNLVHYNRLKYQIPLFKQYGIKKSFFSSLSSKDFPEDSLVDHPWLDNEDSRESLKNNSLFFSLDEEIKSSIFDWSVNGYAVLPEFFSPEKAEEISDVFTKLMQEKKLQIKDKRKIMNAVSYSENFKNLVNPPMLTETLNILMGKPAELFQSVNFIKGSEDPAHSDFIHMSTYPYGYLLAVWIALEDIDTENGPLFYYPGSHRLPYLMNKDFDHGGSRWLLGKEWRERYEQKIVEILGEYQFEKKYFTAKKGDVLIWHANLLHGGEKVKDPKRTRKSMVMHYFGKDVIRYHEVSQRPSLK